MTHIRKFMISLFALMMFACSSAPIDTSQEQSTQTESQELTTSCTTDANCTGGVAPRCASAATGKCEVAGLGGVKTCEYTMTLPGSSTCQCKEGDIQSCKTGAYPTLYDGIQTCIVTSTSPVTTVWGSCALASPTFYGETMPYGNERNCHGTIDCDGGLGGAGRPMCADWDQEECQSPTGANPRECIYRRSTETGCDCVQFEARACTISGGGAGHQICNAYGGTAANDWGYALTWGICQ